MYSQEDIAAAGLDDFRRFLWEAWTHLGLRPKPWMDPQPTPVQLDIAKYLQHGPRRCVIEAFRGVGKSWITASFVCWLLFLDPNLKIMAVSANADYAADITRFCKRLINEMPLLQHLQPRANQRDSSIMFDVGPAALSKDPSMKSVGITGQLSGSRADVIISDDVEVPGNSFTPSHRDRIADLVREYDAVLKPNGRVIYLGTPQTEESLYNRLPERGYEIRIWTAEIPKNPAKYGDKLAPFIHKLIAKGAKPGDPVDPTRFDRQDLDERLLSWARSGYALQYMLDTSASDADKFPLKLHDLIVHDVDRELGFSRLVWGGSREMCVNDLAACGLDGDFYVRPAWKTDEMQKWQGTVMAIDPSGRGRDETAYAIVRLLNAQLYLVEVGGFKEGFGPDTLNALAIAAVRNRVNYCIIERNYGDGMFTSLFRPVLIEVASRARLDDKHPDPAARPPRIDDEWDGWVSTQKEARILDVMEPLTQQHRLCVDRKVIETDIELFKDDKRQKYSWVYQFTRLFRERGALAHDDRIEAISMACHYWTDRMDRDQQKMAEGHKQDLLQKELDRFTQVARGGIKALNTGGTSRSARWTSRPV